MMAVEQNPEQKLARIFARYLAGVKISSDACDLYCKAVEMQGLICEGRDRKIERFLLRFPFWTGCIDAALTLSYKQSVVRKKIFVMLAVLESIPRYAHLFLSRKFSFFYIFKIILVGIRSVYRFLIGFIILNLFLRA